MKILIILFLRFRTSICEFIKPKLQEERQWDWFTAETCEAQYKQLYNENVKSSINNETPLQQIIRSLKSSSLIPYCTLIWFSTL